MNTSKTISLLVFFCLFSFLAIGQKNVKGYVKDAKTGESLFAVNVIEKGTTNGTPTDFDGMFTIKITSFPVTLSFSSMGYQSKELTLNSFTKPISIKLEATSVELEGAEVVGEKISEKQKQAPLTVETMGIAAIKEAPTGNFYEGLGNLKGVDLTSASLGFKVINTRGFNSTSPVRSLQLIDGVDNQSPGLNFSLGNFLGASDLDVMKVDIVAGASSAFYGPGAFNGVINMTTKDPFLFPGVSVSLKAGERNLIETAVRIADVINNKKGEEAFAFKLNLFTFNAHDWEADNYNPINDSRVSGNNPGRYDAVNVYGDEYVNLYNLSTAQPWVYTGMNIFYRTGYKESDLVNYNTNNLKGNFSLHKRFKPELSYDSPTLSWTTSASTGSTVYQGDNRFYLKDIFFIQNRLEFSKKDKYFIRAYMTAEDAGNSFDPYATALRLQENARSEEDWFNVYVSYWQDLIPDRAEALGFPQIEFGPDGATFDFDAYDMWIEEYNDTLASWHTEVEALTNTGNAGLPIDSIGHFAPGTTAFNAEYSKLIAGKANDREKGTRFSDKSKLYHAHGEYIWTTSYIDKITLGANYRIYQPNSEGTIFEDTISYVYQTNLDGDFILDEEGEKIILSESRNIITNQEWGAYVGLEKKLLENKIIIRGALRADKNKNFKMIMTPALSMVYTPRKHHTIRGSFTSALRNPTLADQYLFLDVGRATLKGNLNGADSLITVDSFVSYLSSLNSEELSYFDIAPIQPEQVKSFEIGYRGSFWKNLYVDMSYYLSKYTNFIGYNVGIKSEFGSTLGLPINTEVFRYAANSTNDVVTQGYSIGYNLYATSKIELNGNYSWNNLVKVDENDPIIPAFNTPEHKVNAGFAVRKLSIKGSNNIWGFGANYKWIEGFVFEGSPQFTGEVPTYQLIDGQINFMLTDLNMLLKIGASNILNNKHIEVYGGPAVGRLAYFSILYELKK